MGSIKLGINGRESHWTDKWRKPTAGIWKIGKKTRQPKSTEEQLSLFDDDENPQTQTSAPEDER